MRIFLGIGAGPIQTGIFVSGASRGGYDRIVLADVDKALVRAVKAAQSITVNTAEADKIISDTYFNIEIFDPSDPDGLSELKKIAAQASAICTGLPSTSFYKHIAPWLKDAFASNPDQIRFVYAAENSTTAAKDLEEAIGSFSATYYLDTVIGKMSKVFDTSETDLPPLASGMNRGHLVEEFNIIYTGSAPGIEDAGIEGLYPKADLEPFEYAKLYGHNASHFLMAVLAGEKGCRNMDQAPGHQDIMEATVCALKNECGAALCRKFAGADAFFTPEEFNKYADELIARMTSKTLSDSIDRVLRDLERKLGWEDRIIGAIRMCLEQHIFPEKLILGAKLAAQKSFGYDREKIISGLKNLWHDCPKDRVSMLIDKMFRT